MSDFIETLELTDELSAVNAILFSVGEAPIPSLDNVFTDAEAARDLLRQRLRAVQLMGWTFNTDLNFPLAPDNLGIIYFPANTLSYKLDDANLTKRGNRLYDRANHTYEFTSAVTATELVTLLSFDECPEALRLFVTIAAGRRFQDRYQGDQILHKFQATDEVAAWASLQNYEAEVAQYNMLSKSSLVARLKGGR